MYSKSQHSDPTISRSKDYTISRRFTNLAPTKSAIQDGEEDGILSYMARVNSPVHVTFSPGTSLKQKSRVANQTLTTMFKIRPIKRRDRKNGLRVRAPESTLPSLQYISPWISIAKEDNGEPRQPKDEKESMFFNSRSSTRASSSLPRSVTDLDFSYADNIQSDESEYSESFKTNTVTFEDSHHLQPKLQSGDIRSVSAKTQTSDKRVTFSEKATDSRFTNGLESRNVSSSRKEDQTKTSRRQTDGQTKQQINEPEFYRAFYLPPGISDQVAHKMNSGHYYQGDMFYPGLLKTGQFYKPFLGGRTLFMRDSFPAKPVVYQSDIDQLRCEGHERLMKSAGQVQSHFSMFRDRGSLIQPKDKGMHLEEALKRHQRLSRSADNTKLKRSKTSIEVF